MILRTTKAINATATAKIIHRRPLSDLSLARADTLRSLSSVSPYLAIMRWACRLCLSVASWSNFRASSFDFSKSRDFASEVPASFFSPSESFWGWDVVAWGASRERPSSWFSAGELASPVERPSCFAVTEEKVVERINYSYANLECEQWIISYPQVHLKYPFGALPDKKEVVDY